MAQATSSQTESSLESAGKIDVTWLGSGNFLKTSTGNKIEGKNTKTKKHKLGKHIISFKIVVFSLAISLPPGQMSC
jgi:hypothetical protein